jgi:hypothetical protein
MRWISAAAMVVMCAACQQPGPTIATMTDQPPAGEAGPAQPPPPPPCNSVTVPVSVNGQQLRAVVESCQQPDGSWQITQNTPGLPPQVYVVPPPPAEYPYPTSDYYADPFGYPYWAANPWSFGLGPTIIVAQRFPRFRHGFHHGVGHGFHRGVGHGFHHGAGRFRAAGGFGGRHR